MINKLIRIAETLDENHRYASSDFITDIIIKIAQIGTLDDTTDILNSGEEAPEFDIHPFKAKLRPDIGRVLEGDPYGGGTIDFTNSPQREKNIDYYAEHDVPLARRLEDWTNPDAPGRKQEGELIFGPHTIKLPRNKTKFSRLTEPEDIDEFGSAAGLVRRLLSSPEQIGENTEDYWKYQNKGINDKYKRMRSHNQYWGTNSHDVDRDLKLDKILEENLNPSIKKIQEYEQQLNSDIIPTSEYNRVEKPYKAWDSKTLDMYDKKSPTYNKDLMNMLLDIKKSELLEKFGPMGMEETEAEKLALSVLLRSGYDLRKNNRTPEQEQLGGYLEANPDIELPGAEKSFYPGQTYEAEVHPRNGVRNRYLQYNPETGSAGGFTS